MESPLISGCKSFNTTTGQFDEVDMRPEKQMAVWKPGRIIRLFVFSKHKRLYRFMYNI